MSEHRVTLRDGLHAPAHARAWIAALPALPAPLVEDTLLIASELVTNAVRHGRPDIELLVATDPRRIRVEVRDSGDSLPVVPSGHPSVDRPTGRGLLIVAATADDWGVDRHADASGKTVWAELRLA